MRTRVAEWSKLMYQVTQQIQGVLIKMVTKRKHYDRRCFRMFNDCMYEVLKI